MLAAVAELDAAQIPAPLLEGAQLCGLCYCDHSYALLTVHPRRPPSSVPLDRWKADSFIWCRLGGNIMHYINQGILLLRGGWLVERSHHSRICGV